MNRPSTPGYDPVKVRTPGSAILKRWVREQGPAAVRARQERAQQAQRLYGGASYGRLTSDWVTMSTSADAEVYTSLRTLRNRVRQLVRDNEYARQALRLIVSNIVGQGIGMQAQVMQRRGGKPDEKVNDKIEALWSLWGSKGRWCDTAGRMNWADIQRAVIRGVAESGDILLRKVPRKFADSPVPFALELIEADQLVENWSGRTEGGNEIRMGVEVDQWKRPVAYWLYPRHPGDIMYNGAPPENQYLRVPAEEIIHIGLFERPTQTRCVPWFHAAMLKLRHIGGYEEAEIVRARASASIMGFLETSEVDLPDPDSGDDADGLVDGERVIDMSPGIIKQLAPGEKFNGFDPSTPNPSIEPFMRFMLRSFAAGVGVSYESVSRDYSQSNYSSSRLALLDDRDQWRMLQQWLIATLHQEVYEAWLEYAVYSNALDLPAYETLPQLYHAVRWTPRGWDWVDPAKEVAAAKAAIRGGMTTLADVCASKGDDWRDIMAQLRRERDLAGDYDLVLDTDPAQVNDKGIVQPLDPVQETDTGLDDDGNPQSGGSGPKQDDPGDSSGGSGGSSGGSGGSDNLDNQDNQP